MASSWYWVRRPRARFLVPGWPERQRQVFICFCLHLWLLILLSMHFVHFHIFEVSVVLLYDQLDFLICSFKLLKFPWVLWIFLQVSRRLIILRQMLRLLHAFFINSRGRSVRHHLMMRVVIVELEAHAAVIWIVCEHWWANALRLRVILATTFVVSCSLWEKCRLRVRLWYATWAIAAAINLMRMGSATAIITSEYHHLLLLHAEIGLCSSVLL